MSKEVINQQLDFLEDTLICSECGKMVHFEDCDIIGACSGNLFCSKCNAEIDGTTGEKAEPCKRWRCSGCFPAAGASIPPDTPPPDAILD